MEPASAALILALVACHPEPLADGQWWWWMTVDGRKCWYVGRAKRYDLYWPELKPDPFLDRWFVTPRRLG